MRFTRLLAVQLADEELAIIADHMLNLTQICMCGGLSEWKGGIEQLSAALLRISTDIEATRKARIQ